MHTITEPNVNNFLLKIKQILFSMSLASLAHLVNAQSIMHSKLGSNPSAPDFFLCFFDFSRRIVLSYNRSSLYLSLKQRYCILLLGSTLPYRLNQLS